MPHNGTDYTWLFAGLLLIFAIASCLRWREALIHKELRAIRDSQVELLKKISGAQPLHEDFPSPSKNAEKPPMPEKPAVRRAEAELLMKVWAAVESDSRSPLSDHAR